MMPLNVVYSRFPMKRWSVHKIFSTQLLPLATLTSHSSTSKEPTSKGLGSGMTPTLPGTNLLGNCMTLVDDKNFSRS